MIPLTGNSSAATRDYDVTGQEAAHPARGWRVTTRGRGRASAKLLSLGADYMAAFAWGKYTTLYAYYLHLLFVHVSYVSIKSCLKLFVTNLT